MTPEPDQMAPWPDAPSEPSEVPQPPACAISPEDRAKIRELEVKLAKLLQEQREKSDV